MSSACQSTRRPHRGSSRSRPTPTCAARARPCARPSAPPARTAGRSGGSSACRWPSALVLPFLGLPARDRHRRVADLGLAVVAERDVNVLEPVLIVTLGKIGARLRPARLLALLGGDHDRLRAVEHEAQLE